MGFAGVTLPLYPCMVYRNDFSPVGASVRSDFCEAITCRVVPREFVPIATGNRIGGLNFSRVYSYSKCNHFGVPSICQVRRAEHRYRPYVSNLLGNTDKKSDRNHECQVCLNWDTG